MKNLEKNGGGSFPEMMEWNRILSAYNMSLHDLDTFIDQELGTIGLGGCFPVPSARMIGFGENLGSGFPLILSAWNEKHWLEPELIEQKDLKQVKLVLHFRSENVVKDGGNSGGNKLTERQEFILALIREDHTISARVMSEKITERTIERELSKLKKDGVLSRVGGRKNGEWVINW